MLKKHYLLFLWISFTTVFCVSAQQPEITLKAERKSLADVLSILSTQYHFTFAYSTDQVNVNQQVSVSFQQENIETVLRKLFAGTDISYSVNGTQVVLFKNRNHRYIISGRVREKGTGELLIGVIVNTDPPKAGSITNGYGFYSLSLPEGVYQLQFNYLGFNPIVKTINLSGSMALDLDMEASSQLAELIVSDQNVSTKGTLNTIDVPLKAMNEVPMILGEKDVVKYIMLMPGLQKGNEGNSYMYVRGGSADQNLILMDDAVIYNAYHYLGLSSLFSGSELRSAELIKGGFSAKYGGRLSSVLTMNLKDGNREHFGGEATMGVISSKIMLEGPIIKNKSSFMVSAKKSYINTVSKWVTDESDNTLGYSFYDIHAKVSTDIGPRNRLMVSGYYGNDALATGSDPNLSSKDDGISWGNRVVSMRWNHQFSGKLFSNTSLSYSNYQSRVAFGTYDITQGVSSSAIQSGISDLTLKTDVDYWLTGFQRIKTGVGVTRQFFTPTTTLKTTSTSSESSNRSTANQLFAYGEYDATIVKNFLLITGVRLSAYQNTTSYIRLEPRLNLVYTLPRNWGVNLGYALMNQYVHLISTFNGLGLPSDIWMSTDDKISPQQSQQLNAGLCKKKIWGSPFSLATEVYYKYISDMAVLREGASFFQMVPLYPGQPVLTDWRELLTQGDCRSYGIELLLKKEGNHLSGWISYTLSKTEMKVADINLGRSYPANYDRRHDLGIYLNYKTGRHFAVATNWLYGSGYPISLPVGEYFPSQHDLNLGSGNFSGTRFDIEAKNNYRMKPYHRMDVSIQYHHVIARKIKSTIELSAFNVYNRANAFYYQVVNKDDSNGNSERVLRQTSLFTILPSLSWTIQF
ncbi:MAG: secretin and TonB N-terminal domain-containing protein [Bacteroidota bacterium]